MKRIERFKNLREVFIDLEKSLSVLNDSSKFATEVFISFRTKAIDEKRAMEFMEEVDVLLDKYRLKEFDDPFVDEDNIPPNWFLISSTE